VVLDKRAAAGSLLDDLTAAGVDVTCPTAAEVMQACGQFYDACRDDELRHVGTTALASALAGASKREQPNGAWSWDRVNVAVDISPLVAVTLALWAHRKFGADADYDVAASVGWGAREVIRLYGIGVYFAHAIERLYPAGLRAHADRRRRHPGARVARRRYSLAFYFLDSRK